MFALTTIDPKQAGEDVIGELHELGLLFHAERSPDDPPLPFAHTLAAVRNIPEFVDVTIWLARAPTGELIGQGDFATLRTEENRHLAQFDIRVHPGHRRQGLGRRILSEIAALARAQNKSMLMTSTASTVPSGEAFLRRIGASLALASHTNQLRMEQVDRARLALWKSEMPKGFALGLWTGPYPEAHIAEIAALWELMNQVPRGDLAMDDFHFAPEHLRQMEAGMVAQGIERWTVFARETATGKIAGFTEVMHNAHRPTIVAQGITGVWPEFRGKRLGRVLKVAMLEKIVEERPQVKFVRTENSDSNGPMLKINTELGFKPYRADGSWQIETAKL